MDKFPINTKEFRKLMLLTGFFAILGVLFYYVHVGQLAWTILIVSAFIWFVIEAQSDRKRLHLAFEVGLFLMLFDFAFENSGWLLGLWHTVSAYAIGVVPLEVIGICFFGGTAWALYLPKKFNFWHSAIDCIVFALFGSLGEWLLIQQGLFYYNLWWSTPLAFLAYLGTWIILHFVKYRIVKV